MKTTKFAGLGEGSEGPTQGSRDRSTVLLRKAGETAAVRGRGDLGRGTAA